MTTEIVHSLEDGMTGFINEQYTYKTLIALDLCADAAEERVHRCVYALRLPQRTAGQNELIVDEEAATLVRAVFAWFCARA